MSKGRAGVAIVHKKGSGPARCWQSWLGSAAGALRCSVYGRPPLAVSRLRIVAFQGCGLGGCRRARAFGRADAGACVYRLQLVCPVASFGGGGRARSVHAHRTVRTA
jgi:hypothetical protein